MNIHRLAIILCSCIATLTANAVTALSEPVEIIQPDGTRLEIVLHGDENFHYYTLADGTLIAKDTDGFYHYATLTADRIVTISQKVGDRIDSKRLRNASRDRSSLDSLRAKALKRRHVDLKQRAIGAQPKTKGLVILVEFSDLEMEYTREAFIEMLNKEGYNEMKATGSAVDYFQNASYGQYSPSFDVFGPYKLSKERGYYGQNDAYGEDMHPTEMIVEACKMAVADGHDLWEYDSDGDGNIDWVYVFYAGEGEADANGPTDSIWPHRWVVNEDTYDDDADVGGVRVYDYACSNEISEYYRKVIGSAFSGVGTFVHEFGHVLGFSDFYNTGSYNTALDPGYYDIMASGNYLNYSRTPVSYSAYERMCLGWLTPEQIHPSRQGDRITLSDINTGRALLLTPDGSTHNLDGFAPSPTKFYIIENRPSTGWDRFASPAGVSGGVGDRGLLITQIQYDKDLWDSNKVNYTANNMGISYICTSAQKRTSSTYYPMMPGKMNQVSVSFDNFSIYNISRDAATGDVSFTISDSLGPNSSVYTIETGSPHIYSRNGQILIESSESAPAIIFDTLGAVVYCGTDRAVSLPLGVYIVNFGGYITKVAVSE